MTAFVSVLFLAFVKQIRVWQEDFPYGNIYIEKVGEGELPLEKLQNITHPQRREIWDIKKKKGKPFGGKKGGRKGARDTGKKAGEKPDAGKAGSGDSRAGTGEGTGAGPAPPAGTGSKVRTQSRGPPPPSPYAAPGPAPAGLPVIPAAPPDTLQPPR